MDEETVNEEIDKKEDETDALEEVDVDDVKDNEDDTPTDDNGDAQQ